jgi:type II secretory pathway pseudopilin PulG
LRPGRHSSSRRGTVTEERGYAMAALLVGLSVMAVVMTMALPVWSTAAKRAREDELVFRGEQYARAIGMYQRKYANALPPSIDVLINEKFLRRKYLDPITGGEFQALTGSVGQATPGAGRGGTPTGPGGAGPGGAQMPPPGGAQGGFGTGRGFSSGGSRAGGAQTGIGSGRGFQVGGTTQGRVGGAPFGAAGGIVGVASKSTEKSLRLYNGRGAYNEWTFVAVQRAQQAGTGAAGSQTPGGGAAGRGGRGAGPGTTPNRPAGGAGSFRPPTGSGGFRPGTGR